METKKKEMSPEDIAKRLQALPKEQHAAELRKIVAETEGVSLEDSKGLHFNLSPEQFDRIYSGMMDEAKKVVQEVATTAEREHDLKRGDAEERATEFISDEIRRQHLKAEEDKIIGKRFAQIMRAQTGMLFDRSKYDAAVEEENKFMKKHYGKEVRDMSLGTDTTGGFLAPELWETRLYQALAKTNYARKYCTLINMGNKELMRLPKMTAGTTAYVVSEATSGTTSQPTFAQFTLQPRKLMVTSNPVSIELLESGEPSIIDLLTQDAMRAFGRKEDEAVFVGSDSVFSGLTESSTNNVILGGSSTSGKTAISQITFDDLFNMENELDEQYTPDDDIQNSGGVEGEAMFWFNKAALNALRKLKGDDQYHMDVQTMMRDKKLQGYSYKRVIDLPSAPAAATNFGVFGNLKYVYVGYRPGIRMDILKEGVVNGANLGTTAQYALRFIEFFDQARIDDEAFAIAKTATT